MFNSIRKTIASFIAPSAKEVVKPAPCITQLPYMGPSMHRDQATGKDTRVAPVAHKTTTPMLGDLCADQVMELGSERVRSSILQFGAWIALSNAFNMYTNMHGRRYPTPDQKEKFEQAANQFHQWNSRLELIAAGLDVQEVTLRLCIPRPARTNEQTDIILARIKGVSVEEVAAQRVKQQQEKAAKKEALAEAFLAEIEGYAFGDEGNPTMKAAQCLAKAEEVLIWIAGWETPDVAELLVAEQDIKTLKHLAHVAELKQGAGEGSRALDEMLLDESGMRQGSGSGK